MKAEPDAEDRIAPGETRANDPSARNDRSFKKHVAYITFIVVAIVALFWRVFFLGETLIDVNTLNNQLPWGYNAASSNYPYNRRDLTDTYVTRDYFVVSAYRDGEFPLWNPYTMAGHPIYADGVTRTLSPFLLFYKFLDVPLGYSIARITELMLAAVFMYVFLIAIGTTANGALMGSLVFGFSAHSLFHLTGLGWWGGLMWLPLILLFADRAIKRSQAGGVRYAILAGVFLAAQFFCGYLPNQIYYVGAVVLYYGFFAWVARRREEGERATIRLLAMMLVTLAVGLALSATQWVPSLELLSYSNRKIVGVELGYVWLPPWYAATLVFPNLFGTAYDAKMLTLFTAIGVSHDHILYLGIAALAPLGFCLYWLRATSAKRREEAGLLVPVAASYGRTRVRSFLLIAAVSLLIMMAAPLYVPVTRYIPILQVIRVAVRAGVLFLFGASALVAYGTDRLLQSGTDALRRFWLVTRRFATWVAGLVMLAVAGAYFLRLLGLESDPAGRGRLAFVRRAAAALAEQMAPPGASLLIPLAMVFVLVVLVWAFAGQRLTARRFFASLVALLLIDLFWNATQFDHTFNRSHVFPQTELTRTLRSLPPGRVLVVPSELETNRSVFTEKIIAPPNTLLPYQIPTVTGKNQQFPRWYREFASLVEPQPNLSHVVFDQYRSPFFDLLDVRYILTHESAAPLVGYDLITTAEGVSLYENKNALPRAFFVREVIQVGSPSASLEALREASFDPRTTAVIEMSDDLGSLQTPAGASANIVEDKRNRVVIETSNDQRGLLVLSDNFYPGWRAYIDGTQVNVLRANHTMRAVSVPAGRHMVLFAFMPASFFVSMYVSLAAGVLTLAAFIVPAFKRRGS